MAIHSSILAWRIPWTKQPCTEQATVHGVAKRWTRLSNYAHKIMTVSHNNKTSQENKSNEITGNQKLRCQQHFSTEKCFSCLTSFFSHNDMNGLKMWRKKQKQTNKNPSNFKRQGQRGSTSELQFDNMSIFFLLSKHRDYCPYAKIVHRKRSNNAWSNRV